MSRGTLSGTKPLCVVSGTSVARSTRIVRRLVTAALAFSPTAGKQYDYVIVGGGLAGYVLANRPSANPNAISGAIRLGDTTDAICNGIGRDVAK